MSKLKVRPRRSRRMGPLRTLFASCHGYIDPSSGAALATSDLLELLAARGHDCRVLSTGVLDYQEETDLRAVLAPLGVPIRSAWTSLSKGGQTHVLDLSLNGVRVTLLPTVSSRPERAPDAAESRVFLDLAKQVCERFRPQVLLTYGGHPANLELMQRAHRLGIAVVFHLHNFGYPDRRTFTDASAVLVPSEYSRRFHAERLGLESTAIAYPLRSDRVVVR